MKYERIEFASQKKVKKFAKEINLILKTLDHREALVTDLSIFWDLPLKKGQLKEASDKLKVVIKDRDKLVDIAEKLARNKKI